MHGNMYISSLELKMDNITKVPATIVAKNFSRVVFMNLLQYPKTMATKAAHDHGANENQ